MVPIRMSRLLSLIHKRFFTTSSSAATSLSKLSSDSPLPNSISSSSITLQFLTDSCGLTLQSALSVSQKFLIHPNKLDNSHNVLQLLKAYHFSDSHIAKLIQRCPKVLHSMVESNLKPKFNFLIENGVVGRLLTDLIATNPAILYRDLDCFIKPQFEYLKSVLGFNESIIAVVRCAPWLLTFGSKDTLQRNVDFLKKEGVTCDRVAKLLRRYPTAMLYKHERAISIVNALKNFGLQPEDAMFIHAFGVMIYVNESGWAKKTEIMKSLGWSEEEVLIVFKKFPVLFAYSEKKIRIAMDFFMNTMKLEHNVLISYPDFLGYSIDKRIYPRYNVIKVLQSRKLIELEKSIGSLLRSTEKQFLKNYVIKYVDKVPDLLNRYRGTGKT